MKPTWDWLLTVMDSTEAQLRFGASLTNSSDPNHPGKCPGGCSWSCQVMDGHGNDHVMIKCSFCFIQVLTIFAPFCSFTSRVSFFFFSGHPLHHTAGLGLSSGTAPALSGLLSSTTPFSLSVLGEWFPLLLFSFLCLFFLSQVTK